MPSYGFDCRVARPEEIESETYTLCMFDECVKVAYEEKPTVEFSTTDERDQHI